MAKFIIISGGDAFLNERRARETAHAALKDMPDAEFMELDASGAEAYEFDEAVSPSLLADRAVVAVANLQNASEDLGAAMVAFAKDAASGGAGAGGSVVVARHDGGPKGKGLVNRLKAAGATVVDDVPDLKWENQKVDFVNKEFRRLGRSVTPDAAAQLAGVLGSNTGELAAMCGQLCFDFDTDPIDLDTAMRYLTANPQATGFEVADRALDGNAAGAVIALRNAIAQGVAIPALIGAISYKLRCVAKIAAVDAGKISEAQARLFGRQAGAARRQLRGWNSAGMARAFEALANADTEAKSSGGDPAYALEQAVELIARKGRN